MQDGEFDFKVSLESECMFSLVIDIFLYIDEFCQDRSSDEGA